MLRQRVRCTACGNKGATLQHPSWVEAASAFCRFRSRRFLEATQLFPIPHQVFVRLLGLIVGLVPAQHPQREQNQTRHNCKARKKYDGVHICLLPIRDCRRRDNAEIMRRVSYGTIGGGHAVVAGATKGWCRANGNTPLSRVHSTLRFACMPDTPPPTPFRCPHCGAHYELVRAKAGENSADKDVACLNCGGSLTGRESAFVLKYFLVDKLSRRQDNVTSLP